MSDEWDDDIKAENQESTIPEGYEAVYWVEDGKQRGALVPRKKPPRAWLSVPDRNCNQCDCDGRWVKTKSSRAPSLQRFDKNRGGIGE